MKFSLFISSNNPKVSAVKTLLYFMHKLWKFDGLENYADLTVNPVCEIIIRWFSEIINCTGSIYMFFMFGVQEFSRSVDESRKYQFIYKTMHTI